MNLSEMSTLVRLQADADIEDAPDQLLSMYAKAAYNDIKKRVHPWPLNRTRYTFTTVADEAGVPFTNILDNGSAATLEFPISLTGPRDKITYVSFQTYIDLSSNTETVNSMREAVYYTVDNGTLYLWPTPSGAVSYTLFGYREFADWPVGSSVPDLPRGFDEAIMWYMLGMYYRREEDLELSQMYMGEFERVVNRQIAAALRTAATTAGPMVLSGEPVGNMSYARWVRANVEGTGT